MVRAARCRPLDPDTDGANIVARLDDGGARARAVPENKDADDGLHPKHVGRGIWWLVNAAGERVPGPFASKAEAETASEKPSAHGIQLSDCLSVTTDMPMPAHCVPKDRRLDRHIAQVLIAERRRRWHDWCVKSEMVHGCPWAARAIAKKIGVCPMTFSLWETGRRYPTTLTGWALWAAALECDFLELLCEFVQDETGRNPRLVWDWRREDIYDDARRMG